MYKMFGYYGMPFTFCFIKLHKNHGKKTKISRNFDYLKKNFNGFIIERRHIYQYLDLKVELHFQVI